MRCSAWRWCVLAVLLAAGAARGQVGPSFQVTLCAGEILRGQLTTDGDKIVLVTAAAKVPLALDQVASIRRLTVGTAPATGPGDAGDAFHGLKADYYAGWECKGEPRTRLDRMLALAWRGDALPEYLPSPFAVRWSGQITPAFTETYTFSFWHGPDRHGPRLWIDNKVVIDGGTGEGRIALTAGRKVPFRLEAGFSPEQNPGAVLYWDSAHQPRQIVPAECLFPPADYTPAQHVADLLREAGRGLKAEYAADPDLKNIRVVRVEHAVGENSVRFQFKDRYTARWSGRIRVEAGEKYALKLLHTADAKVRLWVDGRPTDDGTGAAMVAGWHDLVVTAAQVPTWTAPTLGRWDPRGWAYGIPSSSFACPPDMPLVALLPPAAPWPVLPDATGFGVEAAAGVGQGRIKEVEFLVDGQVAGKCLEPAYRFTLSNLRPGLHTLVVRATSEAGSASSTLPIPFTVSSLVPGLAPACFLPVGTATPPTVAKVAGGAWQFTGRGDQWGEQADRGVLTGQRTTDGEMIFRITAVTAGGGPAAARDAGSPAVGLQCRQSLGDTARAVSLVVGGNGKAWLVRRSQADNGPQISEVALALPCWLRAQITPGNAERGPGGARLYSSSDGKSWQLQATLEAAVPGESWHMGLVLGALPPVEGIVATVDNVELRQTPLAPDPHAGVQLVDGSVIAGTVTKVGQETVDVARADGQTMHVPASSISKVLTAPEALGSQDVLKADGKTGVIIGDMDFCEGKVVGVQDGAVVLDSVLFGLKRFPAGEVRAIVYRAAKLDAQATDVRTLDGSRWRTAQLTARDGKLLLQYPLGTIELGWDEILEVCPPQRAGGSGR